MTSFSSAKFKNRGIGIYTEHYPDELDEDLSVFFAVAELGKKSVNLDSFHE